MPTLVPHHAYSAERPVAPWELVRAAGHAGDSEFASRMRACGDALRAAGVGSIVLVHGTFVGDDPLGLWGEAGRYLPGVEPPLRRFTKRVVDLVMRDIGNYSPAFARRMEAAINNDGSVPMPVRRFNWSSENHHVGRCEAALALIETLHQLELSDGARILIWGHSHGGNVAAIVSWLLSAQPDELDQLFDAALVQFRSTLFRRIDRPLWERVGALLRQHPRPLAGHPLDFVTLGMPLRHRFTLTGEARLINFVHHRPRAGFPEWRARGLFNPFRMLTAADGDSVQHLGIAGTNFPPPWPPWRALRADWRLNRLLQGDVGIARLWSRLRAGQRVADDGRTLLVDYGRQGPNFIAHLLGHGVYTRSKWMLWHLEEIVRRWYDAPPQQPAEADGALFSERH